MGGKIVFPVGLKYHALHHLFPSLPYYELGPAHRLFIKKLPPDSTYRQNASWSLKEAASALFFPSRTTGYALDDGAGDAENKI